MRCFLVLFALVAAANCRSLRSARHHHLSQNVTEMISSYGYPVQNFTVQTEDGYKLDVIRIPGGMDYKEQFEQKQKSGRWDDVATDKPVVVLMHGIMSSAEDFVIGGPTEGLAFYLADQGFDVFMANARGNMYARKHTTLNPEKDAAFWKFCWAQIGTKDLPAIIDAVLKMTKQSKVSYIGHMQGTTAFYTMAAERPEYNDKVDLMISLGPMAFMSQSKNQMLSRIAENLESNTWQMKNLGANEFHPSNDFMATAGQTDCVDMKIDERICQNPFFLFNGYESQHVNKTTIRKYVTRLPAGASTKQVLHYAQLTKTGRFESYSEDKNEQPEQYDLSKVTVPMAIMYTTDDKLSSEQDVKMLISKLPHVIENIKISQYTNNLDLLFGMNVRSIIYRPVVDMLKGR